MARIYISSTREDLQNKREREVFFKNAQELGGLISSAISNPKLYQLKEVITPTNPPNKNNNMSYSPPPPVKRTLEQDRKLKPLILWLTGAMAVLVVIFIGVMMNQKAISSTQSLVNNSTAEKPAQKQIPNEISIFVAYGVPYEMVEIPAGEFQMGSNNGESDEKPVRTVRVSRFRMGQTEVTQGLWKAVMKNNPSYFSKGNNYPVENVSWNDCQLFLKKLNQKTGGNYRLPTEAEWEYACRAGTTGDYYGNLDDIAWYNKNSKDSTHPVGQKKDNAFGFYDMSGNVWEWCLDWYGPYDGSNPINPTGPASGEDHVCRGGSWCGYNGAVRSSFRVGFTPDERFDDLGFRLASGSANRE